MKKCLLLCFVLVAASHVFAFTTQGRWRWRNDNGNQITATYIADTNTVPTITTNNILRLRIEFFNSTDTAKDISNTTLSYTTADSAKGPYTVINGNTASDFVLVNSASVADSTPTTQQLPTRSGYTFQAGRVVSSASTYNYSLPTMRSTEFEFVIKPTATVKPNQKYYFQTSVGSYEDARRFPSLITAAVLPVNLIGFGVQEAQGKALVKWTTANETNNDHFEILRSQNGQSWQTIANVKAKGNGSTVQTSYEFTDNTPLNGSSYYRLKQVDKSGSITLSEVKNFSLQGLKNLAASVYPNPTPAAINVMLANYTGNVTATVTNSQGAVIYKQIIAATASASAYRLNLTQKLSTGTYYVNLNGTNLSQKLKVIVQ